MKIDRLLGILSILLQQEKVTAPYLAEKFEVSRRTINRDVEDLCMAGIPLVTCQGKNGGISIMDGYAMEKTLLTSTEMQAILSGLRSLDSVSGSNRYQLLMDKFAVGSSDTLPNNTHTLINLSSSRRLALVPKIELIQNAIEEKKMIQFRYFSPHGEDLRQIEPYYLLFEWSSWYVWGYCLLRQAFRLFKLNRLEELCCLDKLRADRILPEIPLRAAVKLEPEDITVTVLFDASVKWKVIEEFGVGKITPQKDGKILADFRWSDPDVLFHWLLSYGLAAKIVSPKEYQDDFVKLLKEMMGLYREEG